MARIAHLPFTRLHTDRLNFRSGVAASVRRTVMSRFPALRKQYQRLGADPVMDRDYEVRLQALTRQLAEKHGLSRWL